MSIRGLVFSVFLLCSTTLLTARTLESFFEPRFLYNIQIEHDDALYQGQVAFQPSEQWWEIHDENQYTFWFNKKGLWLIDKSTNEVQRWSFQELGTFSPFLAELEAFFYKDVLPENLTTAKLHYQTDKNTFTVKANHQGHIVVGWHSVDGTIVVRFTPSYPATAAPDEWFCSDFNVAKP